MRRCGCVQRSIERPTTGHLPPHLANLNLGTSVNLSDLKPLPHYMLKGEPLVLSNLKSSFHYASPTGLSSFSCGNGASIMLPLINVHHSIYVHAQTISHVIKMAFGTLYEYIHHFTIDEKEWLHLHQPNPSSLPSWKAISVSSVEQPSSSNNLICLILECNVACAVVYLKWSRGEDIPMSQVCHTSLQFH